MLLKCFVFCDLKIMCKNFDYSQNVYDWNTHGSNAPLLLYPLGQSLAKNECKDSSCQSVMWSTTCITCHHSVLFLWNGILRKQNDCRVHQWNQTKNQICCNGALIWILSMILTNYYTTYKKILIFYLTLLFILMLYI